MTRQKSESIEWRFVFTPSQTCSSGAAQTQLIFVATETMQAENRHSCATKLSPQSRITLDSLSDTTAARHQ